jgi:hypothetical protein
MPTTEAGLTETDSRVGGSMVNAAVCVAVPREAPSVIVVRVATTAVFTIKVAEIFPDDILTLAGRVAFKELLASLTSIPPVDAGPVNVIAPVVVLPPDTWFGLNVRDCSVGGLTTRVAAVDTAPLVAMMVATFWEVTGRVLIEKLN